jgi:hypothetical protein
MIRRSKKLRTFTGMSEHSKNRANSNKNTAYLVINLVTGSDTMNIDSDPPFPAPYPSSIADPILNETISSCH